MIHVQDREQDLVLLLRNRVAAGMNACGEAVAASARNVLSQRNPPPSRPGEPPHTKAPVDPIGMTEPQMDGGELAAVLGVKRTYNILAWHDSHGRPWLERSYRESIEEQQRVLRELENG